MDNWLIEKLNEEKKEEERLPLFIEEPLPLEAPAVQEETKERGVAVIQIL